MAEPARAPIERAPGRVSGDRFDGIVIGGGVYGVAILLEAARRGLRMLLLERGDFASGTSQNSLRIVHGGLRYLQFANLPRFRESVAAQTWFLREAPGFVRPLPCLMPLYDEGVYRRQLLRPALLANSLLSRAIGGTLPPGRVMSPGEVHRAFPDVDARGLRGGALWYDAFAPDAPRLLIELLRRACGSGAAAQNYVEAIELLSARGAVEGVRARDLETGACHEYRAPIVVNATGPWSGVLARQLGSAMPGAGAHSLAWNVLFDRESPSDHALAVRPRAPGSQVYFIVPWKGALLAGTGHAHWTHGPEQPAPSRELLARFVDDLNRAIPGLALAERDVLRVFAGLLPVRRPGTTQLTGREAIVDHGHAGGPRGLWSVAGVKLTVAAQVAAKLVARVFPDARSPAPAAGPLIGASAPEDYPLGWLPREGDGGWKQPLRRAIAEESVVHLDDLLLRRSSLGDHPARATALAAQACALFDWSPERSRAELARLSSAAHRHAGQAGGGEWLRAAGS